MFTENPGLVYAAITAISLIANVTIAAALVSIAISLRTNKREQ